MPRERRTIVVTGTSRGLGLAMARGFALAGHCVIGCGRNAEAQRRLSQELNGNHRCDAVDVSDSSAVAEWAGDVLREFDAPDLLVNNAAVINRSLPLWEIPAVEFDRLMAVNVNGTANVMRAFLPAMIARGTGVVANFSSGWGRSASPEVAPYCASKWAIEGLTQALSQEIPAGMAAVAINPGIINTEMLQSCFSDAACAYPSADEWATRAVPFLLSLGEQHNGRSMDVG